MELLVFSPLNPASTGKQPAGRTVGSCRHESFAKFMNRKLAARQEGSDMLGASGRSAAAQGAHRRKRTEVGNDKSPAESGSITLLLGEFMQQLEILAAERESGSWAFSLPDAGLLQELGKHAGMSTADMAGMNEKLAKEGQLGLADFFGTLARHFENLSRPRPVIVPETDLPLLETLLGRMGLNIEQINLISENAVVADGSLDLAIFSAGLQQLADAESEAIILSSWEAGQLRRMMEEAGVSRHVLQKIMAESGVPREEFSSGADMQERFGFDHLQNMLRQTQAAVEAGRPAADVLAFFADLDRILAQAGFQDGRVGWSPAVQQTVDAIYRELLESVNLAMVRIEKASAGEPTIGEGLLGDDLIEPGLARVMIEEGEVGKLLDEGVMNKNGFSQAEFVAAESMPGPGPSGIDGPGSTAAGMRLAPDVQQQVFNQVTGGVLKGLQSNEHHLILKLFPRELGEVKVEMLVRNEQVSLAITAENSRVKEVLENSLSQFRENLERQGFTIGECMVSVDQQEDAGESWQRFVSAWKLQQGRGRLVERAGSAARELLIGTLRPVRENGIDISV